MTDKPKGYTCPQCGRPNMETSISSMLLKCWWCQFEISVLAWYNTEQGKKDVKLTNS